MRTVTGIALSIGLSLCAVLVVRYSNASASDNVTLQGTGATFPAPLYQKWFSEYNKLHP